MPLVATPDLQPNVVYASSLEGYGGWDLDSFLRYAQFPTLSRRVIDSFTVGETHYRLLRPAPTRFEPPVHGADGRFLVQGLESEFIGRGRTMVDARKDWELAVDAAIQRLLATEDFERTPKQVSLWNMLSAHFDLNEIRYSQPMKIRSYGRLVRRRAHSYRVRWIDGSTNLLDRAAVPPEFVTFCDGQTFEAVLQRNSRTWALESILAVFKTSDLPAVNEKDASEFFGSASRRDLRELSWD